MLKMMEEKSFVIFDAFLSKMLVSMATECPKIVIFVDFVGHGNQKE